MYIRYIHTYSDVHIFYATKHCVWNVENKHLSIPTTKNCICQRILFLVKSLICKFCDDFSQYIKQKIFTYFNKCKIQYFILRNKIIC